MQKADKPTVSIIIPTYNHARYLKKCIQSIIDQTVKDWEVIIVNNYSNDNTIEIVESFNDSRIFLINFKNQGIIAASRNEGIRLARADLIAFLDSDDSWYPEKLERCITIMQKEYDLVCHGMQFVKNGKHWKKIMCGPKEKASYYQLLFHGNCLITSAVVVRKKCLLQVEGFNEQSDIVTSEDYDLWLKLSKKKYQFFFIDEALGKYQVHGDSASKAIRNHMKAGLRVIDNHFKAFEKVNMLLYIKFRYSKAIIYYAAAKSFSIADDKTIALYYYLKCLTTFPFVLRAYVGIVISFISTKLLHKLDYY